MIMTIVVVILVAIILGLIIYNININKKIQKFRNINEKVTNLSVVQDFMNTIGESTTVEEKINKVNKLLVDRHDIKYSTIVVFDGVEYAIKASNVEKKHWKSLKSLNNVEMFKESIQKAVPKYVTINNQNETLEYQEMEFGRAKSAIFFPLYIDNVYIGYWIIESSEAHKFDNVDTAVLEIIKENIVSVLKTVVHQRVLEAIVRTDQFTGLYSEEYLYGEGKKIIDKYTISSICMLKIANIEKINKMYSREIGNKMIIEMSRYIKQNLAEEYIFIRHMGPKFVIVFSGVQSDATAEFLKDLKTKVESIDIVTNEEEIKAARQQGNAETVEMRYVTPKLNIVLSRYYKGTGIEQVLKKLEEYLDHADIQESDITNI